VAAFLVALACVPLGFAATLDGDGYRRTQSAGRWRNATVDGVEQNQATTKAESPETGEITVPTVAETAPLH
jgi:hypothetical protein